MNRSGWMLNLRLWQVAAMVALPLAWTAACAREAQLVFYDVVGNSAAMLRHELNTKGPLDGDKRFDAHTAWHVRWTFRYAPVGNKCRLTKIDTSLEGTIDFPRWKRRNDASPSLVEKWEQYLTALRIHEDGHYAHGVAAENEIEALGQSFQITGSCTTMAQAFNDKAKALSAKYAAMDVTYDRATDHGKSQGATFP
jgi:predicted secreted Zn-dependent protease